MTYSPDGRQLAQPAAKRRGAPIVIKIAGVVASAAAIALGHTLNNNQQIDLRVYRLGSSAWLSGRDLYGPLPPVGTLRLPFTYPPFAAVVLSPFALVPLSIAAILMASLTIASLFLVVTRVTRLGPACPSWLPWFALPLALAIAPTRDTLGFGQVNVLLMALATWDCLRRRTMTSGLAVGLAAAIKLTPAFILVFFIAGRDFRSTARGVAAFATATLIGFLVAPSDSQRYWLGGVFRLAQDNTSSSYWRNQSWYGALRRMHAPGSVWVLMVVVTVVCTVLLAAYFRRDGEDALALASTSLGGLLVSPISWDHHWVWLTPIMLAMLTKSAWCFRPLVFPVLIIAAIEPFMVESTYVWLGSALLLSWGSYALWRFLHRFERSSLESAPEAWGSSRSLRTAAGHRLGCSPGTQPAEPGAPGAQLKTRRGPMEPRHRSKAQGRVRHRPQVPGVSGVAAIATRLVQHPASSRSG